MEIDDMTTETGPTEDLITQWAASMRLDGRSPATIRTWGVALRRADRELPYGLEAASTAEIRTWLGQETMAGWTRNTYYSALRSFYRWATDPSDQWLGIDPMEGMRPPRTPGDSPHPCSDEQLERILADGRDPYHLWALLAAYGGLRCGEIARLKREHVDERAMRVHGKGGKQRTVPTHPLIWREVQPLPPGPIARKIRGGQADPAYVSRMTIKYCVRLGMPDVHWHRLRHWHATRVLEHVGDVRVVQELLGHASLATTQRYTAVSSRRQRDAVLGLPTVGSAEPETGGPTASHAPE